MDDSLFTMRLTFGLLWSQIIPEVDEFYSPLFSQVDVTGEHIAIGGPLIVNKYGTEL